MIFTDDTLSSGSRPKATQFVVLIGLFALVIMAVTLALLSMKTSGAGQVVLGAVLVFCGGFALLQVLRLTVGRSDDAVLQVAPFDANSVLIDLPVAVLKFRENGDIYFANRAATALFGDSDLMGVSFFDLAEGLARPMRERCREVLTDKAKLRPEMARRFGGGADVFFQVNLMRDTTFGILATLNDATELKSLEAQFVQSQKMQAVGQLAGGVAHDFNNLLTAINGHCDLLLLRNTAQDANFADLMQIRQNANRAAALVRQLLAFSRKQTLQPKTIRLSDTLLELTQLLNRLLNEKVALVIEQVADLLPVRVDERQFEQVIMNLVVNARDAMPNGGTIKVLVRNICFAHDFERNNATLTAGDYVLVEVQDTGTGMNAEQLGKIFEPFYTTKRLGEGTGLGLSTAYGIVKQTGGFIFADSKIGQGTTFSIFLPAAAVDDAVEAGGTEIRTISTPESHGKGRILLAEDEDAVRSFAARSLRLRGYSVFEADCGEEALRLLDSGVKVDMFISDVMMPGLDGPSWVRLALQRQPGTKVIFVSGYAEDAFQNGQPNVAHATFLPKPFSLSELTNLVKQRFDEAAGDRTGVISSEGHLPFADEPAGAAAPGAVAQTGRSAGTKHQGLMDTGETETDDLGAGQAASLASLPGQSPVSAMEFHSA